MDNKPLAKKLLKNFDSIKTRRDNYDNVNQIISEYVLPNRGDFQKQRTGGERTDEYIYDATAVVENENLASTLHSRLTGRQFRWFNLIPKSDDLKENRDVKLWLDDVHKIMNSVFTTSLSGFSQQNHEFLLDLCAYGTAIMWVAMEDDGQIVFKAIHPSEVWIEENSSGFVDTVYRKFKYTARQAAQRWGEEVLGKKLKSCLSNDPHTNYDFMHVVMPKRDYERMIGSVPNNLKQYDYIGVYLCCDDDDNVLETKGFYEMPYLVTRWEKLVGEVYGRSPAWSVLSEILMINTMSEITIKAAEKQMDPTLLIPDDGVLGSLQTFPGGVIVGGIDDSGNDLVRPLRNEGRIDVSLEMMEQRRDIIRRAFFSSALLNRPGKQPLTATETLEIQEEQLKMIGPQINRIEDEYLSKLIERVTGLLSRGGKLPAAPDVGVDFIETDIEYISPLSFTQRTTELAAYQKYATVMAPLVQLNPELAQVIIDTLDVKEVSREAAEKSGIPLKNINSMEDMEAAEDQRQQQIQQMQQMEQAQQGADIAGNLSKLGIKP